MVALANTHSVETECALPVAERFVSINGEGPRAGRLAAFIRFTGCNLACSWCDTAWANVENCEHEDAQVSDLVNWVVDTGAACVTLTGGEPVLQPGLPDLIAALAASPVWGMDAPERVIEIETNGAVDLADLHQLRLRLSDDQAASQPALRTRICFTVDCKMPSSGMAADMLDSNYALLGAGDAVKFVVASPEDLMCAQQVIERHSLCDQCTVFLSPVFSCIEPSEIVDFMEQHKMTQVRLQLQLHKIIWPNQDKGV